MKPWIVGSVLALIFGSWSGVWADSTVTLTTNYGQPGGFIGINDGTLSVSNPVLGGNETIVGAYGWTVTGTTGPVPSNYALNANPSIKTNIYTYCIQLGQYFYIGSTGNSYTLNFGVVNSPANGGDAGSIDPLAAAQLQALVAKDWYLSLSSSADAAAFQLAVWEVEYDGGSTVENSASPGETFGSGGYFTSGLIQATAYGPNNDEANQAISIASGWLDDLKKVTAPLTPITNGPAVALNSPNLNVITDTSTYDGLQDQLGVVVLPLPAAMPVGLSMLVGLALVRKVRRRSTR